MNTIAYLGPAGTFSHEAATIWARRYEEKSDYLPCHSLIEVLVTVTKGKAKTALLPLENSIEGTVNLTLDLLLGAQDIQVIGEVILPVHHCLISKAPNLKAIKEVWSHPQALAQCRFYLNKNLPQAVIRSTASTAEAVSQVCQRPELAAVGSAFAAALYRIPILARDIHDYEDNRTRFWVLGREKPAPSSGPHLTSLVIAAAANRPGSLYAILKHFAVAGINLTKIESRPTKKVLGEYFFFIDCEGEAATFPLKEVLQRLQREVPLLKVLGSYPRDKGET
ncbi:MAG: prephenate dehydratase [Clostridia bacterium]|nr:prephenate dehydratase [Clostridia bacterium]